MTGKKVVVTVKIARKYLPKVPPCFGNQRSLTQQKGTDYILISTLLHNNALSLKAYQNARPVLDGLQPL